MQDSSTEALLFDLGGVVFDINFERALKYWASCAGVSAARIKSRYRADQWYERHERGEIDATEYFETLRRNLGIDISDEQFVTGWNAIFEQEAAGTYELFESLASKIAIYAFSNSNLTHQNVWKRKYARTLGLFDEVFVSCQLGLRKPDAAAFRHVTASIGLEPENVLFFDDTRENVDAALKIGMSAVQVRGFADIRRSVTEFLE